MSKNKQLKDIQTNDDKEVKTVEFETESFLHLQLHGLQIPALIQK